MRRRIGFHGFLAFIFSALAAVLPCHAAEPILVMSYNVENWLAMDRKVHGRIQPAVSKPESERNAVADVIAAHRPDIVGVMEMGQRSDLDDLVMRLKARGLEYPAIEWHEGADPTRHVALLSRFPVVARNSQDHIPFDVNGRPEAVERGILDVTVEPAPGYRLRLVGLHLKSQLADMDADEGTLRAKEAWCVRQYLDTIFAREPKVKLLVFGDFNDTRNDYPIKEILGPWQSPASLRDIPLRDANGEYWTEYWGAADVYSRIDYFLASRALRRDIDGSRSGIDHSPHWNDASDHRAIFVTVIPQ